MAARATKLTLANSGWEPESISLDLGILGTRYNRVTRVQGMYWPSYEFPLAEASISRNGFQPRTPLFLEIFLEISEISRLNGSADLSSQIKKSKNQE